MNVMRAWVTCYTKTCTSLQLGTIRRLHIWLLLNIFLCSLAHSPNPIPFGWEKMCFATEDHNVLGLYVDNVTSSEHTVSVHCRITKDSTPAWRFQTFRDYIEQLPELSSFLHIECVDGANISLPWPMKAPGVVGIVVSNCVLTDKYEDFVNEKLKTIPDQLRVLEIRNSVWATDDSAFERMKSPESLMSLTSDYDCGQDSTIEYMVLSNVSSAFLYEDQISEASTQLALDATPEQRNAMDASINDKKMEDATISEDASRLLTNSASSNADREHLDSVFLDSDVNHINFQQAANASQKGKDSFSQLLRKIQSLDIKCSYEQLRVLDESESRLTPVHHFSVMLQGARYPELQKMNYSHSGIKAIPVELTDFRTNFPKLAYLDMSHNLITEVHFPNVQREKGDSYLTVDVRNNEIVKLTLQNMTEWASVPGIFVDIRQNPIHCSCSMKELIHEMKYDHFFQGEMSKYDYIKDVECYSPVHLKGQKLSSVRFEQCSDSEFTKEENTSREDDEGIDMSVVGLAFGLSLLLAIIIVAAVLIVCKIKHRSSNFSKLKARNSTISPPTADTVTSFNTSQITDDPVKNV